MPAVGLFVALGLAAAAVAPQIPPRPEGLRFPPSSFAPPDPAGTRFELANGLPVYVVPDRSLPLVDVVLAVPVGDLDEQPEEAGLASMTAAMLRSGGAGDLDPDRSDDEIDALGARIQTVGTSARSVIALDCGSEALGRGLELLAAIVLEPRFDEERLAQAKGNLEVSLAAQDDDPRRLLEGEWLRLVHGGSAPRGRRLTREAVAAFTPVALADFHRRHYRPEGAVFAVSGDVDAEAVVARLNELFGDWTAPDEGDRPAAGPSAGGPEADQVGKVREARTADSAAAAAMPGWWYVDRPGAQAAIAIGHRGAGLRFVGRPRPLGSAAPDRDPRRPRRRVAPAVPSAARRRPRLPRADNLRYRSPAERLGIGARWRVPHLPGDRARVGRRGCRRGAAGIAATATERCARRRARRPRSSRCWPGSRCSSTVPRRLPACMPRTSCWAAPGSTGLAVPAAAACRNRGGHPACCAALSRPGRRGAAGGRGLGMRCGVAEVSLSYGARLDSRGPLGNSDSARMVVDSDTVLH